MLGRTRDIADTLKRIKEICCVYRRLDVREIMQWSLENVRNFIALGHM